MIDLPPERALMRPWIVCESGDRWLTTVRRFAPELMPQPLTAVVMASEASGIAALLTGMPRSVVLWEVQSTNLARVCQSIAMTTIQYPKTLRLAAVSGLSDRELVLLSELGVTISIRFPEQFPSLATMIQAHFAIPSEHLD